MEEALEQFEDNFQGVYDSLTAWAESILDETGELDAMPAHLRDYFDYETYGRDCRLNGGIWTMETDQGPAVFWNR